MKITKSLVILLGIMTYSSLQAADAIEQCKQLFDEALYEQALSPCIKAATKNHLDSQSILGEIYDRQGKSKETFYWWNRAAKAGYLPARNQLAMKFYYGGSVFGPEKGWPQDYRSAYTIWIEDARNGHATAQFMVAEMHHQGQGVKQDYAEAWAWFNLALEQGYTLAGDSLYEISQKLTPPDKKTAEQKLTRYREKINRRQLSL